MVYNIWKNLVYHRMEGIDMGDSLITVVAIFLAAILMFIFPLMTLADRTDDISSLSVQTSTTEFVDGIRTTGKMTLEDYEEYLGELTSTGNTFDVEMLIQQLDENPGVKTTQAEATKIGENLYYNIYTTQIMNQLNSTGRITLKEGDIVTVTVKNTNQTISQMLRNFFYSITGNESSEIVGQHSGIVSVNGSTSGN